MESPREKLERLKAERQALRSQKPEPQPQPPTQPKLEPEAPEPDSPLPSPPTFAEQLAALAVEAAQPKEMDPAIRAMLDERLAKIDADFAADAARFRERHQRR